MPPDSERQPEPLTVSDSSPGDAGDGPAIGLAAVILTYNEARHIVDCFDSLRWADQIFVFDSFSDDATIELARQAGAIIGQARFQNYAQQRNDALDFLTASGFEGWVFFVDADERGTSELGEEIRQVIAGRPEVAWFVPRHNYIFGRLTTGAGWYPDYQLRLLRIGRARYERPVHEIAVVDGEAGHLHNPLLHYNYDTPAQFHEKQRRYTNYDAAILQQQGVRPKPYTPYSQALRHFWWRLVTLAGYRDGLHGLRLSVYLAYYELQKYRRLVELRREEDAAAS